MIVVDLNLLLYAVNSDAPSHQTARAWWQGALNEEQRLSTRPGLFPRPLTTLQAAELIEQWLSLPPVLPVSPGERHWAVLRQLLERSGTLGNLTTDAHLAALASERNATLYSSDRDFARFRPDLRFVNPLE